MLNTSFKFARNNSFWITEIQNMKAELGNEK